MKFNKMFMLAVAGLAMTACSSDEEMGNNLSGNGVVEVKIATPQLRNLADATTGNGDVLVDGTITVKLQAKQGSDQKTVSIKDGQVSEAIKFYNVKEPQLIEAWINGTAADGKGETKIDAKAMQVEPKEAPAYGSNGQFTLNGKIETADGKNYEMYQTTVQLDIPVARLEISGITHATHPEGTSCKYSALTINGIYLDKVSTTKGGPAVDYSMPAVMGGEDGQTVVVPAPILADEIEEASFLTAGAQWPALVQGEGAKQQAYAFNFYPNAAQQPIVKIYFENATASDATNPVSAPRYAVIKSYNNDPNFKFEAGKIYRITAVTLDDKNIIGDEEGNTLYGVDVTVEAAKWSVSDISGQWHEQ